MGREKSAGITARAGEKRQRSRRLERQFPGNERKVGNEVGVSDRRVKSLWGEDKVHELQYEMCAVRLWPQSEESAALSSIKTWEEIS